jgi:hypothetical protein
MPNSTSSVTQVDAPRAEGAAAASADMSADYKENRGQSISNRQGKPPQDGGPQRWLRSVLVATASSPLNTAPSNKP